MPALQGVHSGIIGMTSMLMFLNSYIYFALPLQIVFINILAIVLTLPFFFCNRHLHSCLSPTTSFPLAIMFDEQRFCIVISSCNLLNGFLILLSGLFCSLSSLLPLMEKSRHGYMIAWAQELTMMLLDIGVLLWLTVLMGQGET